MCCGLKSELVALSGLVKEMYPFMDGEYVAGLWRRDFIKELAWLMEDLSNLMLYGFAHTEVNSLHTLQCNY